MCSFVCCRFTASSDSGEFELASVGRSIRWVGPCGVCGGFFGSRFKAKDFPKAREFRSRARVAFKSDTPLPPSTPSSFLTRSCGRSVSALAVAGSLKIERPMCSYVLRVKWYRMFEGGGESVAVGVVP